MSESTVIPDRYTNIIPGVQTVVADESIRTHAKAWQATQATMSDQDKMISDLLYDYHNQQALNTSQLRQLVSALLAEPDRAYMLNNGLTVKGATGILDRCSFDLAAYANDPTYRAFTLNANIKSLLDKKPSNFTSRDNRKIRNGQVAKVILLAAWCIALGD